MQKGRPPGNQGIALSAGLVVNVRLFLELQTSDAGAAIALGFLFHDAVADYYGKANGGWWRYNKSGNGLGVP